jgi:hypothetical protein
MSRNLHRVTRAAITAATFGFAALTLIACGSDKQAAAPATSNDVVTTEVAATSTPSVPPVDTATTPATDPPTSEPATTAPATTVPAVTTTTQPDALQQVPGVAVLTVSVSGDDQTRPTFSWTAPANAASYQLVVQDATGAPVWGWAGRDTTVPLGGVARPADAEGPTLVGPSRVRVYAFAADSSAIAVSPWVPLAG